MFRKYTALAAAWLLMVSLNASLAECDFCADGQMGSIPTYKSVHSTFCTSISTIVGSTATFSSAISTKSANCSSISHCSTTWFPLWDMSAQADEQASATQPPSTGVDYTTQSLLMQEQKMANLLSQDRKNNGRTALVLDEELSRIARIKSADMRDKGYFAHESPTYGDIRAMLKQFGYPYAAAGENIAHHANVDKAQAAFMSSPGHRANILNKAWTKVGIGIVYDRNGYIYATQIFAR